MNNNFNIYNIILTVIFTGLGIVIPILFHVLNLGSVFLPMFLPLAIGSFFLSIRNAVLLGFFTPLLSALLTGMPPFYPPIAFIMMAELTVFCVLIAVLRTKTSLHPLFIIIAAILAERAVLALCFYFILPMFGLSFAVYTIYDMIKGLPGIILLLIIVPVFVPQLQNILKNKQLFTENGHTE